MVDPWGRNWFRIRITRPSQNRSRIYIRSRLRRIDPPRDHSYGKCGSSILPTLNSLFVSFLSSRQSAPLRFPLLFLLLRIQLRDGSLHLFKRFCFSSLFHLFNRNKRTLFNISSKVYLGFENPYLRNSCPILFIFKVFFFFLIVLSLLYRYTFTRNNVQQVYV